MALLLNQIAYLFRNDDGSETLATAKDAPNTPVYVAEDSGVFRLRFEIQEYGGTSIGATLIFQLQYSKNGGSWSDVNTTSSNVRSAASAHVANATGTSDILQVGTGSFAVGEFDSNNGLAGMIGGGPLEAQGHTELEFGLQLQDGDVASGDVIQFRVRKNSPDTNPLDAYVAIAELRVGSPPLSQPRHVVVRKPKRRVRQEWRVIHKNHEFIAIGECFPSNLNFQIPLSAVGDCSYELSIDDPLATWRKTFPYITDYLLMYGEHELQAGIHTGVGISDLEAATLQVSGADYLQYLDQRWYPFDPLNLAAGGYRAAIGTDVFKIVEDLLDATLALSHSLELTYDNGLSGHTVNDFQIELGDTEYLLPKIEALSKKSPGFDYEITPQREVKLYAGMKGNVRSFAFEQGRNIYLVDYANRGPEGTHTLGIAQQQSNRIARSRDHTGIATYRRLDVHDDLALVTTDAALVQSATDAESERNLAPRLEFSCRYVHDEDVDIFDEVATGDRVPVYVDLGWIVVDDLMRITNIQGVTDDEGNFELVFSFDDGTLAQ